MTLNKFDILRSIPIFVIVSIIIIPLPPSIIKPLFRVDLVYAVIIGIICFVSSIKKKEQNTLPYLMLTFSFFNLALNVRSGIIMLTSMLRQGSKIPMLERFTDELFGKGVALGVFLCCALIALPFTTVFISGNIKNKNTATGIKILKYTLIAQMVLFILYIVAASCIAIDKKHIDFVTALKESWPFALSLTAIFFMPSTLVGIAIFNYSVLQEKWKIDENV